jgi:hypothetical protein
MRSGTALFFLVFSVSVGFGTAAGCSDDGGVGKMGGVGGRIINFCTVSDAGPHAEPPPPPDASAPPNGTGTVTFAVTTFFLGDTDRDGGADKASGWKQLGFDLDGVSSASCPSGLCMLRDNATETERTNGIDGIDNSFGRNLLPVLLGGDNFTSQRLADALALGKASTILISIDGLSAAADATGVTARLYESAPLGHPPANDGTDAWPVRPETLAVPTDLGSAKLEVATAYLVGDVFVARFTGALPIQFPYAGDTLHLTILNPVVSMTIAPTRGTANRGTVAGILDADATTLEARRIAGLFYYPDCSGAGPDSIANQVDWAADILRDGTQDPTKTCNGVSLGLGFNATRAQLGTVAAPESPPYWACPPVVDAGDGG